MDISDEAALQPQTPYLHHTQTPNLPEQLSKLLEQVADGTSGSCLLGMGMQICPRGPYCSWYRGQRLQCNALAVPGGYSIQQIQAFLLGAGRDVDKKKRHHSMAAGKEGNEETWNKLRKGKTVISKSVTETSYYISGCGSCHTSADGCFWVKYCIFQQQPLRDSFSLLKNRSGRA